MPIPVRTAGVALASFVLLGLPTGALGVAWPYIRGSFGLPLAALGGVLAPMTLSYLLAVASSGHLIVRLGLKRVLVGAMAMFVIGSTVTAISPGWWFLPLGMTIVGLGGGSIDAALNAFAATNGARGGDPRLPPCRSLAGTASRRRPPRTPGRRAAGLAFSRAAHRVRPLRPPLGAWRAPGRLRSGGAFGGGDALG